MEYRQFSSKFFVRIDRGEEIVGSLKQLAAQQKITLASVSALGAVGSFTVGVYKVEEKKYYSNSFEGDFEIVSLTGTVTTMDGEAYTHLHMSAADSNGVVFGGHLNTAVVSATCEMVVDTANGRVDRRHDEATGLNLFDFDARRPLKPSTRHSTNKSSRPDMGRLLCAQNAR